MSRSASLGLFLVLGVLLLTPASARADAEAVGYPKFAAALGGLLSAMQTYCRGAGAAAVTPDTELGDAGEGFVRACGRSLHDRPVPGYPEWRFLHNEETLGPGARLVTGVTHAFTAQGRQWVLNIGRMVTIARPHNAPERYAARPDASLFIQEPQGWRIVWTYTDTQAARWHRPPMPDGTMPQDKRRELLFLEKVFAEQVRREFPHLSGNLADTRGLGFN